MKLKLDEQGHVVVQDEKPVYQDEAEKDAVFDYAHTYGTIKSLQGEAKSHREANKVAENSLKKALAGSHDGAGGAITPCRPQSLSYP